MPQYTPMIQQYLAIKADYQDAFLFFRLGDFYEMFFDDAIQASQILEITLTSRDGGASEKIPMCGIPYHSAKGYIDQLINNGYKVAICDQVEDAKFAKGVVKREVVQLITPGTLMDGKGLDEKENNYLAAISEISDQTFGLAYYDLSTGEGRVTIIYSENEIINELYTIGAKEIVIKNEFDPKLVKKLKEHLQVVISYENESSIPGEFRYIIKNIEQANVYDVIGRLIQYLQKTQKRSLEHLQEMQFFQVNQFMKIDYYSKRNLELTETIRSKGKKGSLIWLLDQTMTAMGGRLLKQWIDKPLVNKDIINYRLSIVETLINQFFERLELRESLKQVYDLERLAGRVAFGNVNARDLIQLNKSLKQVPIIQDIISKLENSAAQNLSINMDTCESLTTIIENAIKEDPPLSIKEGDLIKDGFNEQLDKYRDARKNGKVWIAQLEKSERELTGIKTLKVGYNRVFGYYLEVTKANLHLLPEGRYERKQTLANAERYITPELKEKEALILEAEEKIAELEYNIFSDIREQVKQYIPRLQALAKVISELDVFQCFATVSNERHYTKPLFDDNHKLFIKDGRHPVVEKVMDSMNFVPNDCYLEDGRQLLLITGPNMSGKSTYMRQVALSAILAQMGCFVPATEAILPIFDQVFTRIGAADDLISGQSTFMVEMLEAKNALTNATKQSLILFDEIGRGTSTYDGMAIAQAIIEYIHDEIGAKTLFSTHYHELTILDQQLANLKNIHVRAVEENGKVVFVHKLNEGPTDKSYGIHVAELAGLPENLITRARHILSLLEQSNHDHSPHLVNQDVVEVKEEEQLSFFHVEKPKVNDEESISKKEKQIIDSIKKLSILDMTPLDAMNKLYEIQKKLKC